MPLGEGVLLKRGVPPPKKSSFYYYRLAQRKRLQIGTDVLLIITSTGYKLLGIPNSMTLNDFEPAK